MENMRKQSTEVGRVRLPRGPSPGFRGFRFERDREGSNVKEEKPLNPCNNNNNNGGDGGGNDDDEDSRNWSERGRIRRSSFFRRITRIGVPLDLEPEMENFVSAKLKGGVVSRVVFVSDWIVDVEIMFQFLDRKDLRAYNENRWTSPILEFLVPGTLIESFILKARKDLSGRFHFIFNNVVVVEEPFAEKCWPRRLTSKIGDPENFSTVLRGEVSKVEYSPEDGVPRVEILINFKRIWCFAYAYGYKFGTLKPGTKVNAQVFAVRREKGFCFNASEVLTDSSVEPCLPMDLASTQGSMFGAGVREILIGHSLLKLCFFDTNMNIRTVELEMNESLTVKSKNKSEKVPVSQLVGYLSKHPELKPRMNVIGQSGQWKIVDLTLPDFFNEEVFEFVTEILNDVIDYVTFGRFHGIFSGMTNSITPPDDDSGDFLDPFEILNQAVNYSGDNNYSNSSPAEVNEVNEVDEGVLVDLANNHDDEKAPENPNNNTTTYKSPNLEDISFLNESFLLPKEEKVGKKPRKSVHFSLDHEEETERKQSTPKKQPCGSFRDERETLEDFLAYMRFPESAREEMISQFLSERFSIATDV